MNRVRLRGVRECFRKDYSMCKGFELGGGRVRGGGVRRV